MGSKVNFHISGHGQLNGNLRIDKTIEMDSDLANRLRVDKKALLKFVETQYPGAKISENSLSVRLTPIQSNDVKNEKDRDKPADKLQKSVSDEKPSTEKQKQKLEKQKLHNESERENLQHRIQVDSLQVDLEKISVQNRQLKIDNLNKAYNGKPRDFMYYIKISWIHLDKGWKKALVIFIIWAIIASIYSQIADFFKN